VGRGGSGPGFPWICPSQAACARPAQCGT
jgi:hypothetical protein